jgi:stalled ribosome rescue protein Dom34
MSELKQGEAMSSTAAPTTSTAHQHAIVWIDHLTAKVFGLGLTGVDSIVVLAHLTSTHLHHKANSIGAGKVESDPAFFTKVGQALQNCTNVLIVGPGTEKVELQHYLRDLRPEIVLHAEASDHPTDKEIIARGKAFFGFA